MGLLGLFHFSSSAKHHVNASQPLFQGLDLPGPHSSVARFSGLGCRVEKTLVSQTGPKYTILIVSGFNLKHKMFVQKSNCQTVNI